LRVPGGVGGAILPEESCFVQFTRAVWMGSFLTSLWRRLLQDLGLRRPAHRSFELDEDLLLSVQRLARREQRPEEDVAADLLSYALARRDAAEANLRRWRSLSDREQEVTAFVCLGLTNAQIAVRLSLSTQTIKTHVRNVLIKFDLHSKAELRQLLADWDFSGWGDRE
jgi:DNA-binding NarL/FixJ family response regulator